MEILTNEVMAFTFKYQILGEKECDYPGVQTQMNGSAIMSFAAKCKFGNEVGLLGMKYNNTYPPFVSFYPRMVFSLMENHAKIYGIALKVQQVLMNFVS